MIHFKEDFGEIDFLEDVPCVVWRPTKFMDSAQFRKLMGTGVDFYKQKKSSNSNLVWLNDASEMKVIGKDDQKWLEEVVNMQAVENGLKYMAFVLPENIFGKIAVKSYVSSTLGKLNKDLTIKSFSDRSKAIDWLKEGAESI